MTTTPHDPQDPHDPHDPGSHTTVITPAAGGLWTDEVGVITGAVELCTRGDDDGAVQVWVRYQDADEWYTVRGGACRLQEPADVAALHQLLAAVLDRPEG